MTALFAFENSYARLPARFYHRQSPEAPPAPALLALNAGLARELGLDPDALASDAGLAALSGREAPEGAEPLAMAYAGHQFGGWVPQLGDGRALLLGEVRHADGALRDVQLKGSGRTPFSRMGDGKSALGPVLREYLVSEAMHALGVPTTRALAAVTTGETVVRQDGPQPGGVMTRVARGHVRVGTFQYFFAREDVDALRALTDYALDRWHRDAPAGDDPGLRLLGAVAAGQAELVAHWMSLGFIHGVMNTDNMSIACETIDYGPCAFMDATDRDTVFSSIDAHGRYAWGAQPGIAQWNLARLAQALLPVIDADAEAAVARAQPVVDRFPALYAAAWRRRLSAKLGLPEGEATDALAEDWLAAMQAAGADWTNTWRDLSALGDEPGEADAALQARFGATDVAPLLARWRAALAQAGRSEEERRAAQRANSPAVIPRNHLVEAALQAAVGHGDLGPFKALHAALARPFEDPADPRWTLPPAPEEVVRATFCGT